MAAEDHHTWLPSDVALTPCVLSQVGGLLLLSKSWKEHGVWIISSDKLDDFVVQFRLVFQYDLVVDGFGWLVGSSCPDGR